MGSNQSKLCSGDAERENRRAEQERVQQMHAAQQASMSTSVTSQAAVHLHCNEDDEDLFWEEANTACVRFNFKVVKAPAIQPEGSLEDDKAWSLSETSEAVDITSAILVEAKMTEPGEDVAEQSEPCRDVMVRSEPNGDITVGTDAQPTELDLPLARLCNEVVRVLRGVEKSFRDVSMRTSACSPVKDILPSCTESHPSMVSSTRRNWSPPGTAVEPQKSGDGHYSKEETCVVSDQKAPRDMDLELAAKVAFGGAEEPVTEEAQLDEEAQEEATEETPPGLSAGTSDECSSVSSSSKELAEILPRPWKDLPQVASEPHLGMNSTGEKVWEGYRKAEDVETWQEVLRMRAPAEMLTTSESDKETELPIITSRIFHNSKWALPVICPTGEKVDDGVLFAGGTVNVYPLKKDGSIPTAEGVKLHECKMSVVQNMEAQPPVDVEETAVIPSSPKALLEIAEVGQEGPMKEPQEVCPDEPIVQGTGMPVS